MHIDGLPARRLVESNFRRAIQCGVMLFAPVGAQPLKPQGSTASFAHRLAMTRLAIATQRHFALSMADAPHPSGEPNYTLETLERMRAELPAGGGLYCLMGADSLAGLREWHRAAEIPFVAPLIVASRPGQGLNNLQALLPAGLTMETAVCAELPASEIEVRCYALVNASGQRTAFYLLPGLDVEISASQIRESARTVDGGLGAGHALLPDAVSAYIRAHGLYR